ncbi:Pol polyprotein [Plakobranchus ocellatus]|uniref:Pol polyprotein n=1 Tax=Plakobranchus ocellatus TaxID=259542 RepID=A0AAV4A7G5_9GAST|nr:Pol polyprotein [Plakobranchus ocellatus]
MSELELYAKYLDLGDRLGKSGDDLAAWVEDKVDLYLERFESHATAFVWDKTEWAWCLANLLQDEALSVLISLSPAEGADYQSVKRVLLRRFHCDRNGFKAKFLSVKPQDDEDFGTFINRAKRYFDRWVELSGVTTLEGLSYLVCSEIALQACDENFSADRNRSSFNTKRLARVSSLDLIRAVVLVWPRVLVTSHVISVVARDMCGVSAQVVQRKLILLVLYLNYLLIVVLLRVVVIVECQIKPRTGRDRPAPFQPVPIVGEPFERVMIDLVGPLQLSSDSYEYLLTLVEISTRWAEAVPLRRITVKDMTEALFSIFVRLGFPKEIQSDRGQQFMSKLLAEFNSLCNIKHFVSTPYHPQTNGILERLYFHT